jgi:MGT family glycosyltransferase
MLVLAARLRQRGHVVRGLGPAELGDRFADYGLDFTAVRSRDEWTGGHPIEGNDPTERSLACLRGMAEDVRAEIERQPTDALVVDYMQPDALSAAEASGRPWAALVHTLYTRVALGDHSPMAARAGLDLVNVLRKDLDLGPLDKHTDLLDGGDLLLVTTVAELDRPERALPRRVCFTGPLVEDAGPDAGWRPPPGADPLVAVSLGTTDMEEGPVLQRVLDALADAPVRVVVTVGDHLDPAALAAPANAVVSGRVRHAAVLPHAQLVVDHGGLGIVNVALAFGVPQVCLPLGRDQPANAAHAAALGVARVVDPEAPVDEIRDAVLAALDDDGLRRAAARECAAIRERGADTAAFAAVEGLLAR